MIMLLMVLDDPFAYKIFWNIGTVSLVVGVLLGEYIGMKNEQKIFNKLIKDLTK